MRRCIIFCCSFLLYYYGAMVLAEAQEKEYKVILNNGHIFYGAILERQDNDITFGIRGGQINFQKSEIKEVTATGRTVHFGAKKKAEAKTKKTALKAKNISNFDDLIIHFSKKYKLDPAFIKAVIRAESNFDQYCVSHKGAKGLMQLMPDTARCLGVFDIYSPHQNIEAGTRYLAEQLRVFGDVKLALAAYNAGPDKVKKYKGIPPFKETKDYVNQVMSYWRYYNGHSFRVSKPIFIYTDESGNVYLSDVAINNEYKKIQ